MVTTAPSTRPIALGYVTSSDGMRLSCSLTQLREPTGRLSETDDGTYAYATTRIEISTRPPHLSLSLASAVTGRPSTQLVAYAGVR
jgi:hypothetical protein